DYYCQLWDSDSDWIF
nr:immunoglobulin light chain junction region [Macaca mulatta]